MRCYAWKLRKRLVGHDLADAVKPELATKAVCFSEVRRQVFAKKAEPAVNERR